MTIAAQPLAGDDRSEAREPVLYRTRIKGADGVERSATLVNISPAGFMARCDNAHASGDRITLTLPRLGRIAAEVRWFLGGRIGCRLERPCGLADYHALLHVLPRG